MINCPSVFISSTSADLKQARLGVREVILHSGCLPLFAKGRFLANKG